MGHNIAFPYFPDEDIEEILQKYRHILSGHGMLTMGQYVKEFEASFSQYIQAKHAVVTNSCTSALEISLQTIGIGADDEVIVPTQTFIATGSCVVINKAKLVFCETDHNFLLDFEDMKRKITPRTKAVIIVHFCGLIHPEIWNIKAYLQERNITLIEDAAHAHGAWIDNTYAGNIADLGCFSFYSTKIMTTAEGGMLTTSRDDYALKSGSIRNRGLDLESDSEIFLNVGSNRRMSELHAILGIYQLKRLEEFTAQRNKVASIYKEVLAPLVAGNLIRFQEYPESIRHAYWRFLVFIKRDDVDRNRVREAMAQKEVKVDFPYDPLLHLQPVFRNLYGISEGFLPAAEALAKTHFCLPMHAKVSTDDAYYIASCLLQTLKE